MFLLTMILLGSLAGTAALGIWLFQRLAGWNLLDRLIATLTPSIALILVELILMEVLAAPYGGDRGNQNGVRLTPIFAWVHGYPLYYYPHSGPALGNMYGPVTALVYLPATLFHFPTGAIITAALISVLLCLSPILWLHLGKRATAPQQWLAVLAFLVFCSFTFKVPALSYSVFAIHADAPALGLAGFACAWLYYRKGPDDWRSLALSALFAVLSVWSKQTLVPILVALPTYLCLVEGWRSAGRYLLCLGAAILTLSTCFLLLFNPQRVIFSLITAPGSHDWGGHSLKPLIRASKELGQASPLFLSLVSLGLIYPLSHRFSKFHQPMPRLAEHRWLLLVCVSLFLVPTSILGRIKDGGDVNALSPTLYFLVAAAILTLVDLAQIQSVSYRALIQGGSKVGILCLAVTFVLAYTPAPVDWDWILKNLNNNPHQVAYHYAKIHPEEAFFPHDALASLMAEGKLYHLEDGLYALNQSHLSLTLEEFRAYTPAKLKLVADPKELPTYSLKYLSNFTRTNSTPEFPNWVVLVKAQTP